MTTLIDSNEMIHGNSIIALSYNSVASVLSRHVLRNLIRDVPPVPFGSTGVESVMGVGVVVVVVAVLAALASSFATLLRDCVTI